MTPRLFGEAILQGALVCALGSGAYLGWGYYRSGEWPITDNLIYVLIPIFLIAGFLNRLFNEHSEET